MLQVIENALQRFRPETPQIPPTLPSDLRHPERKTILLCLIQNIGILSREQVEILSQDLYQDTLNHVFRPLSQSCQRSGILDQRKQKEVSSSPILNRVCINYSQEEMERIFNPKPLEPDEESTHSMPDFYAGDGPQRKLIKELYSLESLGEVININQPLQESFVVTNRGYAVAQTLQIIYSHRDWKKYGDPLIVTTERSQLATSFPSLHN